MKNALKHLWTVAVLIAALEFAGCQTIPNRSYALWAKEPVGTKVTYRGSALLGGKTFGFTLTQESEGVGPSLVLKQSVVIDGIADKPDKTYLYPAWTLDYYMTDSVPFWSADFGTAPARTLRDRFNTLTYRANNRSFTVGGTTLSTDAYELITDAGSHYEHRAWVSSQVPGGLVRLEYRSNANGYSHSSEAVRQSMDQLAVFNAQQGHPDARGSGWVQILRYSNYSYELEKIEKPGH